MANKFTFKRTPVTMPVSFQRLLAVWAPKSMRGYREPVTIQEKQQFIEDFIDKLDETNPTQCTAACAPNFLPDGTVEQPCALCGYGIPYIEEDGELEFGVNFLTQEEVSELRAQRARARFKLV